MMAHVAAAYDALLAFVGNPQFPVVAATALLVAAGVLWGRNWYLARTNGHAGGVIVDAFTVVAPYLAGLAIIGLALFAAGGKPRPWYETAATLLAALALIRLVMLLLRVSLGKSRAIKTWELRATLIVWSLVAAEALGLLDPVISSLDSIGLSYLADTWRLELPDGQSISVLIQEASPRQVVVANADYGFHGDIGHRFVLDVPAARLTRRR